MDEEKKAAVMKLYRKEADKLAMLNQEAENLLNEGEMLYRKRVLRKAEIARERMDAMREVAAIFGVDAEKGR